MGGGDAGDFLAVRSSRPSGHDDVRDSGDRDCRRGARHDGIRQVALHIIVLYTAMGLVAAAQMLPAIEYGKLSTRWTESGEKTWKSKVPFTEHERYSLKPQDLIHLAIPGGSGLFADPFTGITFP